jgi:hypothetical protein
MSPRPNSPLAELFGFCEKFPAAWRRMVVRRIGTPPDLALTFLALLRDAALLAANFLEKNPSTAGVFANQAIAYFDVWALRHAIWCPDDCWKQVVARPRWMPPDIAQILYVHRRQFSIRVEARPIRVRSAFGGGAANCS